jgi:formylglycine-generating enzyme required for sulfatase activity
VRAFEQREGDLNRDGFITGEELGMYLSGRVASDSRDTQTPRYGKIKNARLNLGDVVFALPRLEVQPPTPAPLDPAAIELAMWQSAEKSNTIADYEEYLRQYSQGRFAGMANNRIAALRGTAANTAPARPEAPSPTPAQALNPEAVELALWQRAEKSNTVADYEEYLRQYKQGRFAANANNRILALRGAAANAAPAGVEAPSQPSMRYARVSGKGALPLAPMSFTTAKVDTNGRVTRLPGRSANGYIEQLPRGVKLEMVEVPGGSFMMGTPDSEERISKDEQPQHRVTIRDFYCGKYEVTQGQWKAVMGSLPPKMKDMSSEFKGDDLPVVGVSWDEAKEFIGKLNKLTGRDYRLLSEAEWEYAARAGTTTRYAFGDGFSDEIINNNAKVEKVGSRGVANAFGLFDMHGNAWEWCEDDYHDSYRGAPDDGRAWMDMSNRALIRVYRDSSWIFSADGYRSARRNFVHHTSSYDYLGFRLSITAQ